MRIKELLKEKRLTQQELADKMNVSLSAVKQMVSAGSLTTATLEKIATALDVPMWQLFASPEEVRPKSDALTLTCPHCGKDINIKVNAARKSKVDDNTARMQSIKQLGV